MKITLLILISFISSFIFSQEGDKVFESIKLDTLTILARSEFDAKLFIQRIKEDTTFYQAFKNLRFYPHHANGNLWVYNKREKEKASEQLDVMQYLDNLLMWQDHKIVSSSGKLRTKKGKYRFTTAEIYYNTFFPKDTMTVSTTITKIKDESIGNSKRARYKHNLKLLIFNPGEKISGIPIIGKKMSIFDDEMVEYYDYKVSIISYNGIKCYQFSCIAKPEYKEKKTVIKHLVTVFNKETMAVLNREYSMRYNSILFQFEVNIKVTNKLENGIIYPVLINYSGYWDIPFKTQEAIAFTIKNSDYKLMD